MKKIFVIGGLPQMTGDFLADLAKEMQGPEVKVDHKKDGIEIMANILSSEEISAIVIKHENAKSTLAFVRVLRHINEEVPLIIIDSTNNIVGELSKTMDCFSGPNIVTKKQTYSDIATVVLDYAV